MRKVTLFLQNYGPLGAFGLALLDSAGVPLPASVDVLLLAVAAVSPKQALLSAALSVLGSAIGTMILFSIARKGGDMYLERHASSPGALRFRAWFAHYGLITVFIPALVPILPLPLKVPVLSAGAMGVRPLPFLATVTAARVIRYFGLAWLGMHLGEDAWPWLKSHGWHLGGFAVALCLVMFLATRWLDSYRSGDGALAR